MSLHCIVWIIKFACLFDVIKNRAHMSFYFFIRIHVLAFWTFQLGIKCSLPILMDKKIVAGNSEDWSLLILNLMNIISILMKNLGIFGNAVKDFAYIPKNQNLKILITKPLHL